MCLISSYLDCCVFCIKLFKFSSDLGVLLPIFLLVVSVSSLRMMGF